MILDRGRWENRSESAPQDGAMTEPTNDAEEDSSRFWNERVGPFYDAAGLHKWFGYTSEFLEERIRTRDVLCLITDDGGSVFPSFRFDTTGGLLPRLAEMLEAIDPFSKDPWGDALWLNAPEEDLDGLTPAEALRTDRADHALSFGNQAGARWLP